MHVIDVLVRDRRATNVSNAEIVCGNSGYFVKFDFDAEWDAYPVKTARFIWNGQKEDVVFTGDTCEVPIVSKTARVTVGVFAGDLRTTTPAYIRAHKSILCADGAPAPPHDDVYAQLMSVINDLTKRVEALERGGYVPPDVEYTKAILGTARLGSMLLS